MSGPHKIALSWTGALVNSGNQISSRNAEALGEAISRGVKVVIATGKVSIVVPLFICSLFFSLLSCSCAYLCFFFLMLSISLNGIRFLQELIKILFC